MSTERKKKFEMGGAVLGLPQYSAPLLFFYL
jgi:hypothetical protein